MAHIEDLAQRVEEQEDLLQKHDQIIKRLVEHISKQQMVTQQLPPPVQMPQHANKQIPTKKVRAKRRVSPPNQPDPKPQEQPLRVHFAENDVVEVEADTESETEADLDNELQEELNDLIEPDHSLKKDQTLKKDA